MGDPSGRTQLQVGVVAVVALSVAWLRRPRASAFRRPTRAARQQGGRQTSGRRKAEEWYCDETFPFFTLRSVFSSLRTQSSRAVLLCGPWSARAA